MARDHRYRQFAAEEHAVEVDRVHPPPVLQRGLLDRAESDDAGAVDQHVQPAELIFDLA